MAEQKYLVDINLNQNELKKPVLENQGIAPENPKDGQIYYATNTGAKGVKVYKTGTTSAWKKLLDEDDSSNFVPTTRKVNNKALSSDITLYGTDIAMSSTDSTTLQTAIDNKVPKPATALTPASKTVISYNADGQITGGSEIGIDSGSTNYLDFDITNHTIKAKVDTTVTESSNKLITSGAVATAISTAVAGVIIPKGSISSTSSLPTLVKAHVGWMYNFSASFTTTSDFVEGAGIEYPAGTNVVIVEYETGVYKYDVFSGFVDTSSFITASSTNTLTNKTIDADDNTISDLTLSNLKSGVLQTSVRAAASASDSAIVSEKAIRTELDLKAPLASPALTGTPTAPTAATGTNTTQVATTAFVQDAISNASLTIAENNPSLTASGGVCTWTITNTLNNADVIARVIEISTGKRIWVEETYTAATITLKMNSSTNIAADTYRAVIIGQAIASS